jgi:hypothetical protein
MTIHPLAGSAVPRDLLVDAEQLHRECYARKRESTDNARRSVERVKFANDPLSFEQNARQRRRLRRREG